MATDKYRLMITFDPEIEKRARDRKGSESFPRIVNHDLEMFYALLDTVSLSMQGYFTLAEAMFLCDVMNSTYMDPRQMRFWNQMFSWSVEDGAKLDGLGEKWSVEAELLAKKMIDLEPVQAMWVWDRIRLFWRDPNKKPMEEFVKELFLTEEKPLPIEEFAAEEAE